MMMDRLDELQAKSIYIVREAYAQCRKLALLWSIGKDSSTLLWLARKAFFGNLPFPVLHIDTGRKFPEMYACRDARAKEFGLRLIVCRNEEALARTAGGAVLNPSSKLECCTALKTQALQQAIARHGFKALLLGIRRDEHGIRAKERYFSPRDEAFKWNYKNQPPELWDQYRSTSAEGSHMRIHPLLHWSELDVWRYIRREKIPTVPLYFARDGKRYRSLGCVPCCSPISSTAATIDDIIRELETTTAGERAGRAQDKENVYNMQKLRALAYM